MMAARCELTDLLVDQCAHCRPAGAPAVDPDAPRIEAQFATRCPADRSHEIEPGDMIVLTDVGWVCEGCADEASAR
jgi:hypothetical protein